MWLFKVSKKYLHRLVQVVWHLLPLSKVSGLNLVNGENLWWESSTPYWANSSSTPVKWRIQYQKKGFLKSGCGLNMAFKIFSSVKTRYYRCRLFTYPQKKKKKRGTLWDNVLLCPLLYLTYLCLRWYSECHLPFPFVLSLQVLTFKT